MSSTCASPPMRPCNCEHRATAGPASARRSGRKPRFGGGGGEGDAACACVPLQGAFPAGSARSAGSAFIQAQTFLRDQRLNQREINGKSTGKQRPKGVLLIL